jgi:hypothetical protein
MKPIYQRNVPPPSETFDHVNFISNLLMWIKPERYLELGVRDGTNFIPTSRYCQKAIGVDAFNRPPFELAPNMEFYSITTDEFFANLDPSIMFDAVFIDADHSHEQSLKDFINVKDRVIEDGFIFFHDTYPYDESFLHPYACNDCYRTALYIKQNFIDEFEVLTIPVNPGVTIVKKMRRDKQLLWK